MTLLASEEFLAGKERSRSRAAWGRRNYALVRASATVIRSAAGPRKVSEWPRIGTICSDWYPIARPIRCLICLTLLVLSFLEPPFHDRRSTCSSLLQIAATTAICHSTFRARPASMVLGTNRRRLVPLACRSTPSLLFDLRTSSVGLGPVEAFRRVFAPCQAPKGLSQPQPPDACRSGQSSEC